MHRLTASAVCLMAVCTLGARADATLIRLDFDNDALGQPIAAGQTIDDEYAPWGVTVTARATNGIDRAITFDSANPTGNDSDLVTPGYHPSNTDPLGNLLILPKDVRDRNRDGLVDDPDDLARRPAGWFGFLYDRTFREGSVTFLDIEEQGGRIRLYRTVDLNRGEFDLLDTIAVPARGDNSVQIIDFDDRPAFDAMAIDMAGSGAVDNVSVGAGAPIPEPATIALLGCGVFLMLPRRRVRSS